ncbi:hypothetical protein L0156_22350 [bacterium]|nr:hypothetical protein [bacterium]
MNETESAMPMLERLQKRSFLVGVIVSAAALIAAFMSPAQFFRSYLFAYVFWVGLALGSLAITLLHHLSGGRWGAVIRRVLESGTRTFPLLALLFLPLIFGMRDIYIWADQQKIATDAILKHKSLYLNIPFFLARTVVYFAVWFFLAYLLNKWSRQEDEASTPELQSKFTFLGGIGLLLYGLTATFAAVDWMMSLEPHWFSTIYGLLVIVGQVLSAFAFVIAIASILMQYKPLSDVMTTVQFHDLGKLMFAFVMIWAYLAFSQFLIIWSGNLPEEIPWYLHRLHSGWQFVALFLVLFHFALPFLLLLSRETKKRPRILAMIALGVFIMRFVDLYWMVGPEFHHHGLAVSILDFLLPVGMGGLWLAFFFRQLKAMPLIPVNDPNLQEVLEHGRT